jgi:PAS domain S-box-containing protein
MEVPLMPLDFDSIFLAAPNPYLVLSPDPTFTVVGVNDAYLAATDTSRAAIVGRALFDIFPDNPDDPHASGARNLRASLDYVLGHGATHTMAVQRYDVRASTGAFVKRYWSPVNAPVFGPEGKTIRYVIHHVRDVTEVVGTMRLTGEYPQHADERARDGEERLSESTIRLRDFEQQFAAQEALRISEARFRQLADAVPQMVWVTRPDGYHEYFNRRWYEFTGVPEGSTDGEGWKDLFHPDEQERAAVKWRQALSTGEPYEVEYRLRHRSGEYRWTLGRALAVRDARGNIERWYGTCTDIHDQKTAEAALRRSREQMELVVRGAHVGVWYCPLPFDKLVWDETVKAHFHLPPDADVSIETFYERVHPEDRERVRRAIADSIDRRGAYDIEYRTVAPDRPDVKWIRASGRGYYDAAGRPTQFDGVTTDVTERALGEARLREESDAVETINRVGRAVAAELDMPRLVQTITDATTQLTGAEFGAFFYNVLDKDGESYSLYSLSGVDRAHFDKFPMPRNTDIFAPTFNGEGVIRLDDVTRDPRYGRNAPYRGMPAGHLPVRSYLAAPVVSRSGEVLGGLFFGHATPGVFTERSERVVTGIAAQAAVAIDNARLFDAARRANAEKDRLLESERAARGEAERASRMKDEFLATLSHELRTPLNAILGWSQILRSGLRRPEDLAEGIDVIERNARAQTQIIEDLLDMSRIISGKIRLDVQRLGLAKIVGAAVETLRPTAEAKGVRLQVVLDPLAGPVSGDPNRLQQVFWNVLTNAVKFTPRGGRVQVLLERVDSHVEVSVIDTGEGIPPEFLPFVFERFRQADASTTRRHGGLGLGLSIVKQLVELHGGTVRAKSGGVGLGATFTVSLPLTVIHPDPNDQAVRIHPRAEAGTTTLSADDCSDVAGVKVLVVDDEPDARLLVKRLLEDCRAVVVTAATATEAVGLVESEQPEVLVSDIGIPGEDGYSLIRRVRALPPERGGNVPAIALTAYARAEDRVRAMMSGFQQHVAKPVEPAELVAVVAILAGRAGRSTSGG